MIDASERANDESGDGTTTCTIIAETILQSGARYVGAQTDLMMFRKGVQDAAKMVCDELDKMALPVTSPTQIH